MSNIKLLDCTLRDGGYVNNWNFGRENIDYIMRKLYESEVDIVEAGFIRDEEYSEDRTVYGSMSQVQERAKALTIQNRKTKLAVMAEIAHPIPLHKIESAQKNDVDIVRVIVWKSKHTEDGRKVDALAESYKYCEGIIKKGYKLCVQPNRTDQYQDDEFRAMLKMFCELSPMAIYVVDSWGTMYSKQVMHYMDIADAVLPGDISLGFHGHNNMMQAFGTAERIVERGYDRTIFLDASIYGIGRGAGNLNLELIARYLNTMCGCSYQTDPMYEIYDACVKELKKQEPWGSSMPFFLSAAYDVNPNYASYFEKNFSTMQMRQLFQVMPRKDAVLYTGALAEMYSRKILGKPAALHKAP